MTGQNLTPTFGADAIDEEFGTITNLLKRINIKN
jgi:hypothetical protein